MEGYWVTSFKSNTHWLRNVKSNWVSRKKRRTDTGGSGRKVCLSIPCGVTWVKLRLICMTGQSAGQWSEEAAGTEKLWHGQTFLCVLREELWCTVVMTRLFIALPINLNLLSRVLSSAYSPFSSSAAKNPILCWPLICFCFYFFPNFPFPADSFVPSSLQTESDIVFFLSLCHVPPFNRLKKWPEVTASLQNNKAVNCPDHVLWELYYLPMLNEMRRSTFHMKVLLLSSLTTLPSTSLPSGVSPHSCHYSFTIFILAPVLPLKTNLNANKANLPSMSSYRETLKKKKKKSLQSLPLRHCFTDLVGKKHKIIFWS